MRVSKNSTHINFEVFDKEQLDPALLRGRIPVELVCALVPLDLVESLSLEVVIAGEGHVVAGASDLRHVEHADPHGERGWKRRKQDWYEYVSYGELS